MKILVSCRIFPGIALSYGVVFFMPVNALSTGKKSSNNALYFSDSHSENYNLSFDSDTYDFNDTGQQFIIKRQYPCKGSQTVYDNECNSLFLLHHRSKYLYHNLLDLELLALLL